jgi:CheY-like chemotaxis protein
MADDLAPDVILLDIIMPDMNGYDVLKVLKDTEKTKNIPVICITGLDSVEDEEKALALDAVDFIRKPFSAMNVKLRVQKNAAEQLQSC